LARRLQGLLTNKHNFCEGALMCRLSPPDFPIQLKLFFCSLREGIGFDVTSAASFAYCI